MHVTDKITGDIFICKFCTLQHRYEFIKVTCLLCFKPLNLIDLVHIKVRLQCSFPYILLLALIIYTMCKIVPCYHQSSP